MRSANDRVTVAFDELHAFVAEVFTGRGLPQARAVTAADALCYGDLCGFDSHGTFNLPRLYLPALDSGRIDAAAEPETVSDTGTCAVVEARRALGLWFAAEAMDNAADRAERHGVGVVSVRGATHFGCAGHHALRAAERGMIGVVASNCGRQRIARPPEGGLAMLGTNPLAVAAPATGDHPFVLDMSTTAVPTGKVRVAADSGQEVPAGWLVDDDGADVTDPSAFDRGRAHLRWLGGSPETGAHKGFGLGIVVELLAAALSGAGLGPERAALGGDGRPHGRDDDIGFFQLAIDPSAIGLGSSFRAGATELFDTLLRCPPVDGEPVRYPGWWEAEHARERRRSGVPLRAGVHRELVDLGLRAGTAEPVARS